MIDITTRLAIEADACRDMRRPDEAALYEAARKEIRRYRSELAALREAAERAERKLSAYVGVCSGDKELTDAVLPMLRRLLERQP